MLKKVIVTDPIMGSSPFSFGEFSARTGQLCVPEEFFISEDCIVHYTLGYISIAGENDTTHQLMEKYDSPSITKDWVECPFEVRWIDDWNPTKVYSWLPCTEQHVRGILASKYSNVDGLIEHLRSKPGETAVTLKRAAFRFIKEEEPSLTLPQPEVA